MGNLDTINILIVDDHKDTLFNLHYRVSSIFRNLDKDSLNIKTASTIEEMRSKIGEEIFHVILLDKDLGLNKNGEKIDGINEIPYILEVSPRSKVLVITACEDVSAAVKAMQNGAVGYVSKNPAEENQKYCDQQILNALKSAKTEMDLSISKSINDPALGSYIVRSKAMRDFDFKLNALSSVNTPVLILGESGLGKTHAAKRLGHLSKAANRQNQRPFVNVNINAIPKTLMESELFGSEKGSFTNSNERKQGLFEAASGGDLFLDEIGDATLELQGSLLKVIEEKTFRRVGSNTDIKMNARIIFATNKDLEKMIKKGEFRADLYARISVITLYMPTLEQRKEDIPYICQQITNEIAQENRQNFSYSDFPQLLKEHFTRDFIPFNIRGIRNDLERLFIFCPVKFSGKRDYSIWKNVLSRIEGETPITQKNYEPIENVIKQLAKRLAEKDQLGLFEAVGLLEKSTIEAVSQVTNSNRKQAELLKMKETTLYGKKNKYFGYSQGESL